MASTKAADIASTVTDEDLRALKRAYQIPSRIQLLAPSVHQRANDFEPRRVAIHEEMLKVGIKFPFEGLAGQFLRAFGIPPGQMTPNSWRIIRQLELWARGEGVRLTGNSLLQLLTIKWSGDFLAVQGRNLKIVEGMPTSNKNWKPRYFFARRLNGDGEARHWDVPVEWKDNIMLPVGSPLSAEEKSALKALTGQLGREPIPYTYPPSVQEERGKRAKRPKKAAGVSGEASSSVVVPPAVSAGTKAAVAAKPSLKKTVEAKKAVGAKRRRLVKGAGAEGVFPENDLREAERLSAQEEEERQEKRRKAEEDLRTALRDSIEGSPSRTEVFQVEVVIAAPVSEDPSARVAHLKATVDAPSATEAAETAVPAAEATRDAPEGEAPVAAALPTRFSLSEDAEALLSAEEEVLHAIAEAVFSRAVEDVLSEIAEDVLQEEEAEDAASIAEAEEEASSTAEAEVVEAAASVAEARGAVAEAEAMEAAASAAEADGVVAEAEAMEAAASAAEACGVVAEAEAVEAATFAAEAPEMPPFPQLRRAVRSRQELLTRLKAVRAGKATEAADPAAEATRAIVCVAGAQEAAIPATEAMDAAATAAEASEDVAPAARTGEAPTSLAESDDVLTSGSPQASERLLEEAATSVVHDVKELLRRANEGLRLAKQSGFKEGKASAEKQVQEAVRQRDERKEEAEKAKASAQEAEARALEAEARADQADERAIELQKVNDHLIQHAANEAEQAVRERVDLLERRAQEAEESAERAQSALKEAKFQASALAGQIRDAEVRASKSAGEASISAESAAASERKVKRLLDQLGKVNAEASSLRARMEKARIDEMLVEGLQRQLTESKAETVAARLQEAENSAVYYNTAVEDIRRKYPLMDFSEFLIP